MISRSQSVRSILLGVLWTSIFCFLPLAAQAEPFNCYCGTLGDEKSCVFAEVVEAKTASNVTPCVTICEKKGNDMCAFKSVSVNPTPSTDGTVKLVNPLGVSTVPQLVANILKAAIGIVGALALLTFIYGGFIWLTSGGDAGKVQAGKDAMKWAAIGLAVIFTSYTLVRFVFSSLTG